MKPGVFWFILIAIFVITRVLRKARAMVEEQGAAGADQEGFQAAPEEIQEFLRSLTTAAQRKAAGGRDMVAFRPGAGPARPMPQGAARASFWEPAPAAQPVPAARSAPEPRPARPKKPRKKRAVQKSPPREVLAARPAATAAPRAPRGGRAPVLALRGSDLKRAVVWSEILGPPVSLRRTRRLPSGPQQ